VFAKIFQLLKKLVIFSTSSLLGTIVDMLVLWICAKFIFPRTYVYEYIASPFISYELACLTNFTIAYFYIWKDRVSHVSNKSYWKHFAAYNTTSLGAFLVKLAFMQAIHFLFPGMNVLICNFLALCVSGGINFAANEWLIFRKKGDKIAAEGSEAADSASADTCLQLDEESFMTAESLDAVKKMVGEEDE